jgi:bifunctional DNA-binding transcriptional regulator/antitoxin component of YhaV-PrlF toxin-antitoxin module
MIIPAEVRKRLGLTAGTELDMVVEGFTIRLIRVVAAPPTRPARQAPDRRPHSSGGGKAHGSRRGPLDRRGAASVARLKGVFVFKTAASRAMYLTGSSGLRNLMRKDLMPLCHCPCLQPKDPRVDAWQPSTSVSPKQHGSLHGLFTSKETSKASQISTEGRCHSVAVRNRLQTGNFQNFWLNFSRANCLKQEGTITSSRSTEI